VAGKCFVGQFSSLESSSPESFISETFFDRKVSRSDSLPLKNSSPKQKTAFKVRGPGSNVCQMSSYLRPKSFVLDHGEILKKKLIDPSQCIGNLMNLNFN
jgi:hypothetical protein